MLQKTPENAIIDSNNHFKGEIHMSRAVKLALVNNKGGSAKTTTAVNLAGAYSKKFPQKKILIVESDGQGNTTRSFNLDAKKYEHTMYDVFMDNFKPEDCVINIYNNIDLIPANPDMNFVEFDIMNKFGETIAGNVINMLREMNIKVSSLNEDSLKRLIESQTTMSDNYFNMLAGKFDDISESYDIIIFDTPPEIKAVTSSILAITDEVIIPFEPETYSVDGIVNILSRIADIKLNKNKNLNIAGLLAVRVRIGTNLHSETIRKVMRFCMDKNIRYFKTEVPNSIKFGTAVSKGAPATISQAGNVFVDSYFHLLDELLEIGVIK